MPPSYNCTLTYRRISISVVKKLHDNIFFSDIQFCLGLCVSVVMKAKQNVVFIDTCGGFSADRLAEIAESLYGEEVSNQLYNILVSKKFQNLTLQPLCSIKDNNASSSINSKLYLSFISFASSQHLEHILQSVKVIEAFDIFQLMTALQTIKEKMVKKVTVLHVFCNLSLCIASYFQRIKINMI